MAKLTLRTPWTSQPQSPVIIDWGNPLSRDLAFVAIGGQPIDLVNGKLGTYVGTAGVGYGPKGKAFTTASGAANRIDFTKASPANRTGELSFGSIFKVDSDTGALQYLINRDAIANLFMVRSGALTIQQTWNATGLFQSTNVVVAGTWNIASSSSPPFGSSTALDAKLWLNRRKEVAGNATNGALGTTSLGDTILHGRVSDNLRQVNGAQALAVSWNRVLSDAEHASWQADPWQLFAPIRRTIWVPNAGGGGGSQTLTPSGIASSEAFGSHLISMGLVNLSPTAIASAEAFGSHTLSSIVALAPSGIATAEAFGTNVITVGGVTISPSGISSGEVFGSHIISQAGGTQTVLVNGIPSDEAFGSHLINAGTIIVTPTGIASQEGFGTASVLRGTVVIFPNGIPSGELFGIPALVGGTPSGATTVFYVRGFSSYGQRRNR